MADKMRRRDRRKPMLSEGTCTDMGKVLAVRKRTKKFGRHYLVGSAVIGSARWMRRDHFNLVPCQ